MTDASFLLALLQDRPGEWIAQTFILERSQLERGCGMTVHSRAPELRRDGHIIENRVEVRNGRRVSFYRLVSGPLSEQDQGQERRTRSVDGNVAESLPGSPSSREAQRLSPCSESAQ